MKHNWETETALMLKNVNAKTEELMALNLPADEFHKRHQEIMDYWDKETKRLQTKYPAPSKPKAIPKANHKTQHLTDKFLIDKLFKKLQ